jgi:hypothetical protein
MIVFHYATSRIFERASHTNHDRRAAKHLTGLRNTRQHPNQHHRLQHVSIQQRLVSVVTVSYMASFSCSSS